MGKELREEMVLCHTYCLHIKDMVDTQDIILQGVSMTFFEDLRVEYHDKLCVMFGVSKEDTKRITDNLDKIEYDGGKLWDELHEIRVTTRELAEKALKDMK